MVTVDFLISLGVLILLAFLGFLMGRRLAALGAQAQIATLFGSLIIFAANQWLRIFPDLETRLFPWSAYYYLANWSLPCVGVFAGAAMARSRYVSVNDRRALLSIVLLLAATFYTFSDRLPNLPITSDSAFAGPICKQSDNSTCAPAAVASYLRLVGIETTEQQAAVAALTRADVGTNALGLWRSLHIVARASNPELRAKVVRVSYDELIKMKAPVIVRVELHGGIPKEYYEVLRKQWLPGLSHAIVFIRADGPEHALIGDPASGDIEIWEMREFEALWGDHYIFYVEDNKGPLTVANFPALRS